MSRLTLRIGSRPSALAMAQAGMVARALEATLPGLEIAIVPIKTSGDRMASASLASVGGKGLFVKELETALDERRIDLSVHSMKDLPARLPPRFRIAATPSREDPRDAIIAREGGGFDSLARGARIGTSSPRRRFQALSARPDLAVIPMRGNVDTRLEKLGARECDAIILAVAGLKRLGRAAERNLAILDERKFIPAGGQGALALEAPADGPICGSPPIEAALAAINDRQTECETAAERAFLGAIGASCATPVGIKATLEDRRIALRAILFDPDGRRSLADQIEVTLQELTAPAAAAAGIKLGRRMLEKGAAELIGDV